MRNSGGDCFVISASRSGSFSRRSCRHREGRPSRDAERLRLDHGAIAALLVPPPDAAIIRTLRFILVRTMNSKKEKTGSTACWTILTTVDTALLLEKMTACRRRCR